jgi:hypothetical protein
MNCFFITDDEALIPLSSFIFTEGPSRVVSVPRKRRFTTIVCASISPDTPRGNSASKSTFTLTGV